jgi:hypothetical protein
MTRSDEPGPPSDEEVFREIVAGFGAEPKDEVPRWPVSEDLPSPPPRPRWPVRSTAEDEPAQDPVEPLPGWVEPAALEDEGHFEPPPPPKVPLPRLRTVFACLVLLLGLAVLFAPFEIGLSDSAGFIMLGLALLTGGAALLVSGMRDAPPTDRGPDDGAVV